MSPRGCCLLACFGTLLTFAPAAVRADEPAKGDTSKKVAVARDIDLVLCLDTSNSMDGLIDAAKQKLWDLVNTMARAKPTPSLRVALYSYGNTGYDAKAGWVRKELEFSTDLDLVFKKLYELKTNGGEEYVARVCGDALRDLRWSGKADALRVLFVCGNESAAQDPTTTLAAVADRAKKQGVLINPIYCGNPDDGDARGWRELAGLAGGRFAHIDQGQKVAVATPFDQKLADLANKVNGTYLFYGNHAAEKESLQADQTENSRKLGAANLAARVSTQNSALYKLADCDLVDGLAKKDGKLDLAKIPEAQLPEPLRKLTPEQRLAYVQGMAQKRETIQKEVLDLSRQRDTFLREAASRPTATGGPRFDAVLQQTIRQQAKTKGIDIPE